MITSQKYFIYARKSTDVEDKQVLSIESQLTELREYAKRENLEIVHEYVEKKSAKTPGRPIFNELLGRIEKEGGAILAWHPDRLARNSVDGGRIIYLVDTGRLAGLKFVQFWFEPTPQGKFMLSIAFGQSKYYVDSLSENTKRGLRQKVRNGEYPALAPIGYINDVRTKKIVVDEKRSKIVRDMFELYAKNDSTIDDLSHFLAKNNIYSSSGKRVCWDRVAYILANPFYYGHFRYAGEVFPGSHQPILSKKLWDQVQEVLQSRGKPKTKPKVAKAYTGLLTCGTCGRGITAETQKGHVYYHCTKKSRVCFEPYIREEDLDRQIGELLLSVSLRADWASAMIHRLETEESSLAQNGTAFVEEKRRQISDINVKISKLTDLYLEQDIDRTEYLSRKNELVSKKRTFEEQMSSLPQKQIGWLEPMRKWIYTARDMAVVARDGDLFRKKVAAAEAYGSNLRLTGKKASGEATILYEKIRQNAACVSWVPRTGIEPVTSSSSGKRYYQLSYLGIYLNAFNFS